MKTRGQGSGSHGGSPSLVPCPWSLTPGLQVLQRPLGSLANRHPPAVSQLKPVDQVRIGVDGERGISQCQGGRGSLGQDLGPGGLIYEAVDPQKRGTRVQGLAIAAVEEREANPGGTEWPEGSRGAEGHLLEGKPLGGEPPDRQRAGGISGGETVTSGEIVGERQFEGGTLAGGPCQSLKIFQRVGCLIRLPPGEPPRGQPASHQRVDPGGAQAPGGGSLGGRIGE